MDSKLVNLKGIGFLSKKEIQDVFNRFSLMDDFFMSIFFEDDLEVTQFVINILLNRQDLIVKKVKTQKKFKNLCGKEIILDILAKTKTGEYINIEMQNSYQSPLNKRARFYASMLDVKSVKKGDDYQNIKDNYVIFVLNNESFNKTIFKDNLPFYNVDRYIKGNDYVPFNDGSHIIYINANYQGDDSFGKLMHDFKENDHTKMHFKLLRNKCEYLKELNNMEANYEFESEILKELLAKVEKRARAYYKNQGLEEGRIEGRAEGRAEGEIKGKETGRSEGQSAMLDSLYANNMISKENYEKVKKELK